MYLKPETNLSSADHWPMFYHNLVQFDYSTLRKVPGRGPDKWAEPITRVIARLFCNLVYVGALTLVFGPGLVIKPDWN